MCVLIVKGFSYYRNANETVHTPGNLLYRPEVGAFEMYILATLIGMSLGAARKGILVNLYQLDGNIYTTIWFLWMHS